VKSHIWRIFDELEKTVKTNEILINSPNDIFYIQNGNLIITDYSIQEKELEDFVRECSLQFHQDRNHHHPIINGVLPDGTRINIVTPPISTKIIISLKKYSRIILNLIEDKSFHMNDDIKNFLLGLVAKRKNIAISGGIGVGKTTFLNMLINEIPERERTIILEDIPELNFECKSAAFLRTTSKFFDQNLCIENIIQNISKMKADRLILGACKGKEFFHFVESVSLGVQGSMLTIHGNSVTDAILKLENFYQLENNNISLEVARRQVFSNIDYVIQLGFNENSERVVQEIYELSCDIHHKTIAKKIVVTNKYASS
jgi:pilus assembly protein CpaF